MREKRVRARVLAMFRIIFVPLFCYAVLSQLATAEGFRRLHGVDGGIVVARILKVVNGSVYLERQDGQVFQTPLQHFAEKDRLHLLSMDSRFQQNLDAAKMRFKTFHGSVHQKQAQEVANLRDSELWEFYLRAIPVLEKAATEGNAPAQYNLGVACAEGLGVRQDYRKAAEWFQKAADQGDTRAQFRLGRMSLQGRGVARDDAQAIQWFTKAANAGHPRAQSHLGAMYVRGIGGTKDIHAALRWLQAAARQGESEAQVDLAIMHMLGMGDLPENPEAATRWLAQAAEKGHPFAQYELGVAYRSGIGVERNFEEAARWIHKSAAQRNPDAQLDLGLMYLLGLGVNRDEVEGCAWFSLAAASGHRMGMEARRNLESRFTKEQQELARLRALELTELLVSNR
ncbi:MAG: sel1 repeat family protein [Opitutae bacterium]|nr:sel1 repeat family protein [Opitutae bacterium]